MSTDPPKPREQSLVTGVLRALGDAAVAGWVIGIVESARLALGGAIASISLIAIGLSLIVGLAVGFPLALLGGSVGRRPWCVRHIAALRHRGAERNRAVWRTVLTVVATLGLGALTYFMTTRTFGRFNAAGALGLLQAVVVVVAGGALVVVMAWLDEIAGPRLEASPRLQSLLSGRAALALLAVATAGVAVGIGAFAQTAAPDADFRPLLIAVVFVIALAAASLSRLWQRVGTRILVGALVVSVAVMAGSLHQVGSRDIARSQVAAHGVASGVVLRGLWRLTDGDGDGFASAFGGGDCDDSSPEVNPDADEIVENGIDDNCAGGDLRLDELGHRTAAAPSSTPDAIRRNVILITIDALRADHVGSYGARRDTTPQLDALAARAARFEWAVTPSPSTRRAIPALMGARYASTLAFIEGGPKKVWPPRLAPKHHTMLGETFRAAGYQTSAILCCTTLFDRRMGVTIGIDHVDASAARLKRKYHGDHLVKRFDAWLGDTRADDKPFFLWIHFLDAHSPYQKLPGAPDLGKKAIDRYASEVWYVDDKVGQMLASLERAGLDDDTIVAVTSDHGEEFYEHGNRFHGRSVYNELIRVPLLIHVPGVAPVVIATPVSVIDVGPTLLDLVGLARPAGQTGRSLAAALRGGEAPDRMVLAELIADRNIHRNLRAGLRGDHKIIWDLDANTYELYSLADDPADKRNLAARAPEIMRALKADLHRTGDLDLSLLPADKHAGGPNMRQRAKRDWSEEKATKAAADAQKAAQKAARKAVKKDASKAAADETKKKRDTSVTPDQKN